MALPHYGFGSGDQELVGGRWLTVPDDVPADYFYAVVAGCRLGIPSLLSLIFSLTIQRLRSLVCLDLATGNGVVRISSSLPDAPLC